MSYHFMPIFVLMFLIRNSSLMMSSSTKKKKGRERYLTRRIFFMEDSFLWNLVIFAIGYVFNVIAWKNWTLPGAIVFCGFSGPVFYYAALHWAFLLYVAMIPVEKAKKTNLEH